MADTEYDVTVSIDETVNADVGSTQDQGGLSIDESVLNLSAESPDDVIIDANISTTEALEVTAEENTGGTDDHRKLLHRDAENQHPIAAITGLSNQLGSIDNTLTAYGISISTIATSAERAHDELDDIKPIVGSTEEAVGNIREEVLENYAELDERARAIADGSLVLKGFANFDETHGVLYFYNGSNKLTLNGSAIVFTRNGKDVAYIQTDDGYGSYLKTTDIMTSYLYMRAPNGFGNLTWIANSSGHLCLKRV